MKSAFIAQFPNTTVDYYIRPGVKILAPAIYFELESIDPCSPEDIGTNQLQAELTFSAKVICTYKQGQKLAVRLLSAAVAQFVHKNRFGQPVTPGVFQSSVMEDFHTHDEEYESWRVNWKHEALLGDNIWDGDGITPQIIMLGFDPNIGPGYEADYYQIPSLDDLPETTLPDV